MTPSELRIQFLDFCGPETFRKFARTLFKLSEDPLRFDRLRYWQESLWASFLQHCPDACQDVNEIGSCLHWCDLHDSPLIAGAGHQAIDLRRSDPFDLARKTLFPHGYGWMLYHCPDCLHACIEWIEGHPTECRMLQYRIHDAHWVTLRKGESDFQKMCRDACMPWDEIRVGDEIWKVDYGRGSTGIALVRNGKIVPIID